jgi:hypothetical protein
VLLARRGMPVIRLTAASAPPESKPPMVAPEPDYLPSTLAMGSQ